MTVIFSKRCELGLQACLFLATQKAGSAFSSGMVSEKLKVPREFVSKVMQELTKFGIIASRKGKSGGFYLAKPAGEIRLIDIVGAIDGTEMFEKCVLGFPGCSPENPCPVHDQWGELRTRAYEMLSTQTLEELSQTAEEKIHNL